MTTSIGELITEKLETINISSSAQEASKKMRDKNVSSLVVIDNINNNKPTGIPLGIITPTDFTGYLKENLNIIDSVNAKIIASLREEEEEKDDR